MLRNKYGGNLGNHLFQYFAAKLLAEKYDLYLDVDPIKGFPETFNETSGCKINDLHKVPFTMSSYEKICRHIEENAISKNKGVLMNKFYGYNYREYYENNMEKAYKWLRLDDSIKESDYDIGKKDILISIRNGDFITKNVNLPFEYYRSILESNLIEYNKIYIVSDNLTILLWIILKSIILFILTRII